MWLVYSIRSLRSHWTLGDSWFSSQLNTADPSSSVSTCSRCLMIFNLLTAGKEKIFLMYWMCLICALKMLHEKLLMHIEDYTRECRLCLILMVWVKCRYIKLPYIAAKSRYLQHWFFLLSPSHRPDSDTLLNLLLSHPGWSSQPGSFLASLCTYWRQTGGFYLWTSAPLWGTDRTHSWE